MTPVTSWKMCSDHHITTPSAEDTAVNMRVIQRVVTEAIQTQPDSDKFEAEFVVGHDIHGYKELFSHCYNGAVPLRDMTALTGSVFYAQATTCGEYVQKIWPKSGLALVAIFEEALSTSETDSYTVKTGLSCIYLRLC
jgi:hypothetical protein